MFRNLLTGVLFWLLPGIICSQADVSLYESASVGLKPNEVKLLNDAHQKIVNGEFKEAASILDGINVKDQPYLNYLRGVCYTYDPSTAKQGLSLIKQAAQYESNINGYRFNLAYAYVKTDSMRKAIANFQKALETEKARKPVDQALVNEITLSIQHCQNLIDLREKRNYVKVSDIGPPINSEADEYCPLIPSNESIMIYTYRGPKAKGGKQKIKGSKLRNIDDVELYFEDIFYSTRINDTLWSEPSGMDNLNTSTHDAAVALNADGTQLFVYRNRGEGRGDLYLSELNGTTWSKPVYQLKLNSPDWDGSACFVPNSNSIIFASERKGGLGGKDLYTADRIGDNMWGNIRNMGPDINSRFDEDAPFVTADGKILFFSSNNRSSIGGYDIFRSDLINRQWQAPYNVGPPINTTDDDNYFTVRGDGRVAYYSSHKKGDESGQDIYKVEPGVPGRPMTLLQVDGVVTVDGKPSAGEIHISSLRNNKDISFSVKSNKATGAFLTNLPAGDEYELQVTVDKFPPQVIHLDALNIDSFVVLNVYPDFVSPNYQQTLDRNARDEQSVISKESSFDKGGFSSRYGDSAVAGVRYRVQVAALKFDRNFDYNKIVGMPKVMKQTDHDKVSRFTMGDFATYNEAQTFLKTVQPLFPDAFVTATFNGERKLLSQLISENILK